MKRKFLICAIVLAVLTGAFLLVLYTVPEGLVLQSWVMKVGSIGILLWQAWIIWAAYLLCTRVFSSSLTRAAKYTGRAFSVILSAAVVAVLAVLCFAFMVLSDTDTDNGNGTITVADSGFLQETKYSLWKKEGILYRRYLRESAGGEDIDPSMTKTMFLREHYPKRYEKKEQAQQPEPEAPQVIPKEPDSYDDEVEFLGIADGMTAIYHETADDTLGYGYRAGMTAKGEPKAVFYEDDQIVHFLIYDCVSGNNECLLYVYYEFDKESDGTYNLSGDRILDRFAYVIDEGKVVSAGITSWSELGSEEFRKAIGE